MPYAIILFEDIRRCPSGFHALMGDSYGCVGDQNITVMSCDQAAPSQVLLQKIAHIAFLSDLSIVLVKHGMACVEWNKGKEKLEKDEVAQQWLRPIVEQWN